MQLKFLITGGVMKKNAEFLGHGHMVKFAKLMMLDWNSKNINCLINHVASSEFCPDYEPTNYFTSSSLIDRKLYLCCNTQVFIYSYPDLKLLKVINHQSFNDLHHVTVINDEIVVACTGLDMVMMFDLNGDLKKVVNVLGKDPWNRFSPDVDYRKIASTKPHESHPNFVFEIDGNLWATRFEQKDAICLRDPSKRIDIGIERVHDGHVYGDYVYFTTVNGHIVVANKKTFRIERVFDLNKMDGRGLPLGWCRGFCLIGDDAFVGFSRLRTTKILDNLRWVKSMVTAFKSPEKLQPSRVSRFNLKKMALEDEFILPRDDIDILFSVLRI